MIKIIVPILQPSHRPGQHVAESGEAVLMMMMMMMIMISIMILLALFLVM